MTNVTESRHTAAPKANTAWSNVRELSRAASAACPAPPCVARASALGLGSCHPSYCVSLSRQFLCYMLIQNFAHRERNNDRVLTRKKRLSLSANPARNRSPRKSPSCGGSSSWPLQTFQYRGVPRGPFALPESDTGVAPPVIAIWEERPVCQSCANM